MILTGQKMSSVFALFTSTGTLFCCALPAAISVVAGGAAVGSFVSAFPWLIPLSRHKGWLFLASGVLIALSGVFTLRPQGSLACSFTGGSGCEVAGRSAKTMFWVSAAILVVGAFMSYAIVPILRVLEG